jgi:L-lactate dehydrogenase complex protein LldF
VSTFVGEFKEHARQITRDLRHRGLIQTALSKYETARDKTKASFQDWQAARQAAAETKWEAINHLDKYLVEFTENWKPGAEVH